MLYKTKKFQNEINSLLKKTNNQKSEIDKLRNEVSAHSEKIKIQSEKIAKLEVRLLLSKLKTKISKPTAVKKPTTKKPAVKKDSLKILVDETFGTLQIGTPINKEIGPINYVNKTIIDKEAKQYKNLKK